MHTNLRINTYIHYTYRHIYGVYLVHFHGRISRFDIILSNPFRELCATVSSMICCPYIFFIYFFKCIVVDIWTIRYDEYGVYTFIFYSSTACNIIYYVSFYLFFFFYIFRHSFVERSRKIYYIIFVFHYSHNVLCVQDIRGQFVYIYCIIYRLYNILSVFKQNRTLRTTRKG